VDPDDWIEPELLEKLYEAQQEGDYDLVASRRTTVACDKKGKTIRITPKHYKEETIVGQQKLRYAYVRMLDMGVVGDPTQKLYKTSIISSNSVTFPALKRTQDVVFNYRYYSYIESLKLIYYCGYNYRKMVQQAPTKAGEDYYKTIVYIYDDYIKMYELWSIPFPDQELCNSIFRSRIYANIQRGVEQGWDIQKILEDPMINHIITKANPKPFYLVITKQLIKHKQYRVLKFFLKIVMIFKQRILKK
jgi:glycosyltransferase EpsJ